MNKRRTGKDAFNTPRKGMAKADGVTVKAANRTRVCVKQTVA